MFVKVLIAAILSAGLHLSVGWEWTIVAGILGGALSMRRGWLTGGLALTLAWGGVLLGSYAMAPEASSVLLGVVGGLIGGNTSPALAVACTLIFGGLLGLTGGIIGAQIRAMVSNTSDA